MNTTEVSMGTFLVALDGSHQTVKILNTVTQLVRTTNAKVIVLSVYRHYSNVDNLTIPSTPVIQKNRVPHELAMRQQAHETVRTALDYLNNAGITRVSGLVKRGGVTRTILTTAKKNKVDAIVIGSRGMGDIDDLLLGSVSQKVNSLAKCTCITVR